MAVWQVTRPTVAGAGIRSAGPHRRAASARRQSKSSASYLRVCAQYSNGNGFGPIGKLHDVCWYVSLNVLHSSLIFCLATGQCFLMFFDVENVWLRM